MARDDRIARLAQQIGSLARKDEHQKSLKRILKWTQRVLLAGGVSPRSAIISAAIDPGILASRLRTSSIPGAGWVSCSSLLIFSMYSTAKLDRSRVAS